LSDLNPQMLVVALAPAQDAMLARRPSQTV